MKGSLITLGFFATGIILGFWDTIPQFLVENDMSMYALYLLMFAVGIGLGSDKSAFDIIKKANFKILLVPFTVILGSLAGTAIISPVFPDISLNESMAIGAGFGYYSLSSIFITQLSGETLGVIALLSNIQREIITLLAAPLMARYMGKLAPIASGGATSMDTCLPIIVQSSGKQYAMISMFSGIVLTLIVPFLVTFLLQGI